MNYFSYTNSQHLSKHTYILEQTKWGKTKTTGWEEASTETKDLRFVQCLVSGFQHNSQHMKLLQHPHLSCVRSSHKVLQCPHLHRDGPSHMVLLQHPHLHCI